MPSTGCGSWSRLQRRDNAISRQARPMIIEMRTYNCFPGKAQEYLKLFEAEGYNIQVPIFGNLIGYFFTEIGPINQIIHMWGFESFEDRERRRATLQSTPEWLEFVQK